MDDEEKTKSGRPKQTPARPLKGEFEHKLDVSFAEVFNQMLAHRKISLVKLAKETGLHANLFSLWRTAKVSPTLANIIKLIDFFDDAFIVEVDGKKYIIDKFEE